PGVPRPPRARAGDDGRRPGHTRQRAFRSGHRDRLCVDHRHGERRVPDRAGDPRGRRASRTARAEPVRGDRDPRAGAPGAWSSKLTKNAALSEFFRYNRWANLRLIEDCSRLSEAQLDLRANTASRSVRQPFAHLDGWFYSEAAGFGREVG